MNRHDVDLAVLTTLDNLTFDRVSEVNMKRCERWHKDAEENWNVADWAVAMVGEVGEACNIIKKLRRVESGTINQGDPAEEELRNMLANEFADIYLYLDLLVQHCKVDLPAAIVHKFNQTSMKYGFPERLP